MSRPARSREPGGLSHLKRGLEVPAVGLADAHDAGDQVAHKQEDLIGRHCRTPHPHRPSAPLLSEFPLAMSPPVSPACILKWTSGWLGASSSLMGPTHSSLCPRAQCSSQHRREQYSSPQPCRPHSARHALVGPLAKRIVAAPQADRRGPGVCTHSPWHTAPKGRRRPQGCLSPPRPPRLAPACPSSPQVAVAHNSQMLHFQPDLDSRWLIHRLW